MEKLVVLCKVTCDWCGIDSVKLRHCEMRNGADRLVLCCDCIMKQMEKEKENEKLG